VLHLDEATLSECAGQDHYERQGQSEERKSIETALMSSRGKVAGENRAAKKLGLPASTLEFRIKKLGIDKLHYRKR
jgi:transcriptional regulator with GAF, ATPase, and Fis domain